MRKLPYILPLLLTLLVVGCGKQESDLPVNTRLGGEFTLTDHNGEPFSQSQLKGKVSILFFGYTHCPDVCPTDLARMGQVLNALTPAEKAGVRGLFISIDRVNHYTQWIFPVGCTFIANKSIKSYIAKNE